MADIEKISVGGTSYDVRDANAAHSLLDVAEAGNNITFIPTELNINTIGTITQNATVISGFSSSSYATGSFETDKTSFAYQADVAFTVTQLSQGIQRIFTSKLFNIHIDNSNNILFEPSGMPVVILGPVNSNVKYIARLEFDGVDTFTYRYKPASSTSWSDTQTATGTFPAGFDDSYKVLYLGYSYSTSTEQNYYLRGNIDLFYTNFYIDSELVWTGCSNKKFQIVNSQTVDQTYDSTSTNAQSGVAVASAIAAIPVPTVDQTYNASSVNAQSGVAIAGAGFLLNNSTGSHGLVVGSTGHTNQYAQTSLGMDTDSVGAYNITIGYKAVAKPPSGSISTALVIGNDSQVQATGSIHLGSYGINTTAGTFSVSLSTDGDWQNTNTYILCDSTGKIPAARMPSGLPKKETYTCPALTSDGTVCTWTVTHTIGTQDVLATVYDTTTNKEIMFEGVHTDSSTYTINITSSTDIASGAYKVVIIG